MTRRRITSMALLAALALTGCATVTPTSEPASGLTELESKKYAQSYAVQWMGIVVDDPPVVEVDHFVDGAQWGSAVAECMTAAGYDGYESSENVLTYPARLDDTEDRALYTCVAKYPIDADFSTYANEAQLSYLYDYYRDTLVPCLATQGFVPPGEAPSRADFTRLTVEPRWNPYSALIDRPSDHVRELCPASPFSPNLRLQY